MDYDASVAGGSFAGLAAAVPLRGKRVLIVEPHSIGAVQTSACGTLLAVLEATGTMDSLLQVHDRVLMHLGEHTVEYPMPYSFCTFDYHVFCNRILDQSGAEVLQASVLGHRGQEVITTRGVFSAEILIDATGWRAALATDSQQQAEPHRSKSFGLETTIPTPEDGLHFYYEPRQLHQFTVGWLFPTGESSRAGLGDYQGRTQLAETLTSFTHSWFDQSPDGRHGGYFPYLRRPTSTENIFRVGDAAGQCIPLMGEGIRPALYFGAMAGCLAQRVLAGETDLSNALGEYKKYVRRHAEPYLYLLVVQKVLPRFPLGWIEWVARLIRRPVLLDPLLQWYWDTLDPDALARLWSHRSESESLLFA